MGDAITGGIRHGGEIVFQRGSDFFVLVLLIPVIAVLRSLCERLGQYIFMTSHAAAANRRKRARVRTEAKKFRESFWKSIVYTLSSVYCLLLLCWEPCLREPFAEYPNPVLTKIYWIYMARIAVYLWMTVSFAWDVKRKDYKQMFTHHLATLTLLILSYSASLTYIGTIVLILHDVAEPMLETAKMFTYLRKKSSADAFFVMFMMTFWVSRLLLYPYFAVRPSIFQTWPLAVSLGRTAQVLWAVLNGCLVTLLGLSAYWSYLIYRLCLTKIAGNELRDNRSDTESDSPN